MSGCFIGLDLGSTAIKAVAVTPEGDIAGTAEARIERMADPDTAAFEIDPEAYIDSIFGIIAKIAAEAGRIEAVSWVCASGNILLLDDSGKACSPMISWLDTRPLDGSIEQKIAAIPVSEVHGFVGWPFSRQFPFGRLLWLGENRPELMRRAAKICTGNDFLGYRMTGNFAIDGSTATTMYMYEQAARRKNADYIAMAGARPEMFSELRPTGSLLGMPLPDVLGRTGLGGNTKIILGCFDHPGAARALGIRDRRQMLLSCGTSWVGLVTLPDRDSGIARKMLVDPFESESGGAWCGMVSVTGVGKKFDAWALAVFRHAGRPAAEEAQGLTAAMLATMNELAESADPLGTIPVLDIGQTEPEAGTALALLGTHSPGEIFRALMESAAFGFRRLLEEKELDIAAIEELSMVGGPSASPVWRRIIAELFGRPLLVRFGKTAGAVGAALIAARGSGFDLRMREPGLRVEPDPKFVGIVGERYRRFREGKGARA